MAYDVVIVGGGFVDMGQHKAVATMLGVRLSGFPAATLDEEAEQTVSRS